METQWQSICHQDDLVKGGGVCALLEDQRQVAIFYTGHEAEPLFAVDNYDPSSDANVIYRGIIGSVDDEPVVASPLYKQHFSLRTGRCLEQEELQLTTYPVRLEGQMVQLRTA